MIPPGRPYGDRNETRRILTKALMPEIGGKKLAETFTGSFGDVRKMLEEARLSMAGAVTELMVETRRVGESEKIVRGETAALKKMNDDVLGNAETVKQTVSGNEGTDAQ